MRKPVIAANWKMHKTIGEAESFAAEFPLENGLLQQVETIIFPPFTALAAVAEALRGTPVLTGAQNMHYEEKGAYTGEISPVMLKDAGCSCVLLGHSERRRILGETSELISKKVKAALDYDLVPILCLGETLEERKSGRTEEVCREQLTRSLQGVPGKEADRIVIAYEPVWAIGTGLNAGSAEAEETIAFIRSVLRKEYGEETAGKVRIQYGGSVKPENAAEYFRKPNIDGALVGGASLDLHSFYSIVKSAVRVYGEANK